MFTIAMIGLLSSIYFVIRIQDSSLKGKEEETERAKHDAKKFVKKYFYISMAIISILMIIPNKKMAVAIYFTPNVVKYLDKNDTKLDKIDDMIDLAIDKAIRDLKGKQ
jgi:hypothetical protein